MPGAAMVIHDRPSRAAARARSSEVLEMAVGEDYSEFLICIVDKDTSVLSVWEQRNAALVGVVLEERRE